jgi:hypothetical protein
MEVWLSWHPEIRRIAACAVLAMCQPVSDGHVLPASIGIDERRHP